MTVALLLALFSKWSDAALLHTPIPDDVAAAIERLPRDPIAYEQLAHDAIREFRAAGDDERLDRFNLILRLLLYHDGRAERGLLTLADAAVHDESFSVAGVNALAALANHYQAGRTSHVPTTELIARLTRYGTKDDLTHNARQCLRAVERPSTAMQSEMPERVGSLETPTAPGEYRLPSGEVIVTDVDAGRSIRVETWSGFDPESAVGTGEQLTDPGAERLQTSGRSVFVLRFQDMVDAEGAVTSSYLRVVEEYRAGTRVNVQEMNREVKPPPHLTGAFIED